MENFDYDLQSIQEARDLARRGEAAANQMAGYTSEQIDRILQNMVKTAEEHAACLAQMAVEETGFGKVLDKTYKNHAASTLLYNDIKEMNTVGIICEDKDKGTMDVAEPVGLIMGIVPSTNPTSTVIYKSMIAIKAGNAIVFSPHPSAAKCTLKAAELMGRAAEEAGAPEGVISCISMPTMGATNELMHCKEVSIIIATGGPGMVKAAYSAGKPAIGVGAGNSPAYIERTADVRHAVRTIIASKTFDNGTICASEQSIICEECNHDQVVAELKAQGEALDRAVDNKVKNLVIQPTHLMNGLEYTDLVNEVAEYSDAFEKVAVGEPLLTTDDDFKAVIKAITEATAEYDDGETAICFMGHGTEAESNQVYSKMQDMLTDAGYKNYYVGTVEASPTVEDVLAAVQAGGYKKVVLEPLMIVAGDHANNDMAGDEEGSWKKTFEDAGYEVTCLVRGLGEMEAIQQLFVEHAKAAVESLSK